MTGPLSRKGAAAAAGGVGLLLVLYCGGYAYLRGTGRFQRLAIVVLPDPDPRVPGAVMVGLLGPVRLKVTGFTIEPAGDFAGPGREVLFSLYLPARRVEEAYGWARGRLTGEYPYEVDIILP